MEIVASLFTIIMSILSFGGLFVNNSLIKIITKESETVKQINVRLTSVPTHQLLKGEADGIQLNLQQWQIRENIRVELLQLETDRVKLNLKKLQQLDQIKGDDWQKILNAPLNMGWRVIVTEKDLNQIFQSTEFQSIINQISGDDSDIEIIDLSFDFQDDNRFILESKIKLAFKGEEELNVRLAFRLDLIKGHTFEIKEIQGTLNNRQLSSTLLQGFANNINTNLSLRSLEKSGITLRLLQFDIKEDNMAIAGFINIQPQSP